MNMEKRYRLADSTIIEPLVHYWSAWPYLISPAPACLHLLHYQIKIMESYLADPEAHAIASQDKYFSSGPFIKISSDRAHEVKKLLAETEKRREACLNFAKCITEFHNRLVAEATGESLEPFYQKIPEPLRGYVELVYDYYNRPT